MRVPDDKVIGYGFDAPAPTSWARTCSSQTDGVSFAIEAEGERHEVRLPSPAATMRRTRSPRSPRPERSASGVEDAVKALARFEGLRRRLETVGEAARSHRDRRFRAQSRQDRRHPGDACARTPAGC